MLSYSRMFVLALFTIGVLLGVGGVGSASATELTCTNPPGTKAMCPVGTEIHAESEGPVTLHPPIGDIECSASTLKGKTSNTGASSETVTIPLESFTLAGCNGEFVVAETGQLEVHTREAGGSNNGTVTWSGMKLTTTFLGFHCIFTTSNTDIGTLTGSSNIVSSEKTPTLDIEAVIPRTGGRSGAFCGSTAQWTGSFKFSGPDWMDVD